MDNSYLIEIRLFGRAKHETRKLTKWLSEKYKILIPLHVVPHITLISFISMNDENRLIKDFNLVCCCTGLIDYVIEGKGIFEDTGVIKLNVQPSKELVIFQRKLRDRLQQYCTLSEWSFKEPFEFHVTILNHVDRNKIRYITRNFNFNERYDHKMLRATLLKNGKILCEYDFLLKKMLNQQDALNKQILMKTFYVYREGKAKKNISLWRKLLCYIRF